ncbi:hypothetical protein DRO21_01475 [archaeon]|nr:MAG: hypothetical protein DRO21_01475 [archaeon]
MSLYSSYSFKVVPIFDALLATVNMLLFYSIYDAYKVSRDKRFLLLSLSFLTISLAAIVRIMIYIGIVYKLLPMALVFVSDLAFVSIKLVAFTMLCLMYVSEELRIFGKVMFLAPLQMLRGVFFIELGVVVVLAVIAVISGVNLVKKSCRSRAFVFMGFLAMLVGNIFLLLSIRLLSVYAFMVGYSVELIGFMLLMWVVASIKLS